jgi:NAD-reducing hydrogenase small subunit
MDPVAGASTIGGEETAAPGRKPRLATVWLGGCSGCHMSFLDLDERLLELAQRVEIGTSPITDFKDFPEVDVTLVEGAVANEEHLEHIRHIRRKTSVLVAFGDCAVTGNVTAMRNLFQVEDVLDRAYRETAALVIGIPTGNQAVPKLLERVCPLHEVVEVDYYLQGCPPSADEIHQFLTNLLDGRLLEAKKKRRFG